MIKESMMKWRVRREGRCNSVDQEDIRRSLEILDNVLAEFDDSADCYFFADSSSFSDRGGDTNDLIARSRGVTEISDLGSSEKSSLDSFRTCSTDGSTSQSIPGSLPNQCRRFSPPPIPKRSPGTRLSAKENNFEFGLSHASWGIADILSSGSDEISDRREATYTNDDDGMNAYDDIDDRLLPTHPLSKRQRVITDSVCGDVSHSPDYASKGDEVFVNGSHNSHFLWCSGCGRRLTSENTPPDMQKGLFRSPSVAVRRRDFENKTAELPKRGRRFLSSDSGIDTLPVTNSPFLKKKYPSDTKFSDDSAKQQLTGDVVPAMKLSNSSSDSKINQISQWTSQEKGTRPLDSVALQCSVEPCDDSSRSVLSDRTNLDPDAQMSPEERVRKLDEKFAKVKRLIKEKKISVLTQKPPDFVPPPPPKPARKYLKAGEKSSSVGSAEEASGCSISRDSASAFIDDSSLLCHRCATAKGNSHHVVGNSEPQQVNKSGVMTNGHTGPTLSHTIEDIPKLLPTDTLLRPQYGLSYSMEEDLSPGVKEILTSTPKSEKIQLSTFSQSVSSLGYGSSQSEQDLNLSFQEGEKVPIITLKSQTLPIGIRMVPPLAFPADIATDADSLDSGGLHRSFDMSKPESDHFRSSSAPPLKHLLKPEKKSLFGKKDKLKSRNAEDEISMKSNNSADDGTRKFTLDGSTDSKSSTDSVEKSGSFEGKRKSVWKSILRRK